MKYIKIILIVFLFGKLYLPVGLAATMSFGGPSQTTVGSTIQIPVYVSANSGESLNAVASKIVFPTDKLKVVSINSTGIIDLWAQKPEYSNTDGSLSFQGISYSPGFSGKNGKVIVVSFKALSKGSAVISFQSPSVLANDGLGTEIFSGSSNLSLNIEEAVVPVKVITPVVASTTEPVPKVLVSTSSEVVPVNRITLPTTTPIVTFIEPSISLNAFFVILSVLVFINVVLFVFVGVWYIRRRSYGRFLVIRGSKAINKKLYAKLVDWSVELRQNAKELNDYADRLDHVLGKKHKNDDAI
jgi:hypothetical protein